MIYAGGPELGAIGRIAIIRFYVEDYLGEIPNRRSTKDNRKWVIRERD